MPASFCHCRDYRWMAYPGNRRNIVHPHDVSLMTCGRLRPLTSPAKLHIVIRPTATLHVCLHSINMKCGYIAPTMLVD
jgi:hypothetical protein